MMSSYWFTCSSTSIVLEPAELKKTRTEFSSAEDNGGTALQNHKNTKGYLFPEQEELGDVEIIEKTNPINYSDMSREAQRLACALNQFKLLHRRRRFTFDELLMIFRALGYEKKFSDCFSDQ